MNRPTARCLLLSLAIIALGAVAEPRSLAADTGPAASSDLQLAAPIDRWDEAIPLGNGTTGGLLWGGGRTLRLSLDRGDLWDLRTPEPLTKKDWTYATIRKLVAEKNQARLVELFDRPYEAYPYPTKLPAGRLELSLPEGRAVRAFGLNLREATGKAELDSSAVEVFYSAVEPVAMLRVPGTSTPPLALTLPGAVSQLGYPPAKHGSDGAVRWVLQEAAQGLKYAVVVATRRVGESTEIALAITSTRDGPDPIALGRRRVEAALAAGFDAMRKPHVAWWAKFWSASGVRLPDAAAQQQYDLVQYFYGAASRRGSPPIPLQGVWTADEGGLPPWKGDYHNDLNTQLTYWAYLASGRFEEGAAFVDFLWDLLPAQRRFAREFYEAPGASAPGVMTLDGRPMGGWGQYSLSPTMSAWLAQAFDLHWRYTGDRDFLRTRAYPYCTEVGQCLRALLKPGPDGMLRLPLSTSPEIHDNSLRAWLTPNTNFDLALLRWHFASLATMADELGDAAAAGQWRETLGRLPPLAVDAKTNVLRLAPDESLAVSHRHLSHVMAIHPLGTMSIEGSERDRQVIAESLADLERLGTSAWCGYSFSWMSCMAARAGQPETALKYLDIFLKAFISRNGFHLNGDYKRLGYSSFSYRPFTLEGNFAAGQAVHEMLLQSHDGRVRLFPAVPAAWRNVAFDDLRAEGGWRITAQRRAGRTALVRITATCDAALRLADPFGVRAAWNRSDVRREGNDLRIDLRAGETLEGRPADAKPEPAKSDAYKHPSDRWEADIRKLEARHRQRQRPPSPSGVVLVGSSSIVGWPVEKSFPGLPVTACGFGGSQMIDSVYYADRIVAAYKPRLVAIYAGDNDLAAGKSPEEVLADWQSFVRKLRAALPEVRIVFLPIKPSESRWKLIEKIRETNRRIEQSMAGDPRLVYLDLHTPLLGPDGKPRAEFFQKDKLHLNDAGYAVWSERLRPLLSAK